MYDYNVYMKMLKKRGIAGALKALKALGARFHWLVGGVEF